MPLKIKPDDWIRELAVKYNLANEIVEEEIEIIISSVLSKRFGFEVEARLNGNPAELSIFGFKIHKGEIESTTINPESVKRPLIREILYKLANTLEIRKLLAEYILYKKIIHSPVTGEIIRKDPNGILFVALKDIDHMASDQYAVAVCEPAAQTPKERGWYKVGQKMPFYVLSAKPKLLKGTPRLEIKLSRNSIGLPERLLRQELLSRNMDINVHCVGRIAGAYSEIKASTRLPAECIKKVSDELRERIIVRF